MKDTMENMVETRHDVILSIINDVIRMQQNLDYMDDSIKANILWVCEDEKSYNQCKDWMQLYGRVCWMYL